MTDENNDVLDTALNLLAAGLSVIPIRADGSKAPAVDWKPYTRTPATPAEAHAWWGTPRYGLGLICGAVSRGLEMVEIEGRAAGHLADLRDLAHDTGLGHLWDTITQGWLEHTPGGGIHWLYHLTGAPVPGNTKLARDKDRTVLAETRGEGGQTVIWPTPGTHHASGRPWTRIIGGPGTAPTLTPDQRDAFHTLLRTLDTPQPPATESSANSAGAGSKRDPADGITPGDDYENRHTWADILTPHGWQAVHTRGRTTYWRRPGKTEGISATTGHADDRDRLYVFSTSTEFDTERPYTKFGAHTVLEHGGDHAAAARHLAGLGYGTPRERLTPREDGLSGLIAPPTPTQQLAAAQPAAVVDELDDAEQEPEPTWQPVNLGPYLDGTHTPPTPTLLHRDDGAALIYPGLIHDLHGESESGKSLIAQHLAATLLAEGRPVLYVDFESDARQVTRRLLDLAATPTALATHLTYIRPEASPYTAHETPAWKHLLTRRFDLAILDGVTDALGLAGGSTKENDDIAAWHRAVPRMLTRRTGAAVILIDHVTKNTDTRGRFAIGGQAKMAAIDGASYTVEIIEPIGKGMRGTLALRVGKDRPGEIRALCGKWRSTDRTQEAARLTVDSTGTHGPGIHITINAPEHTHTDPADDKPFKPTAVMEKVSRLLEARREPVTYRALLSAYRADGGKARERMISDAVDQLVAGRFVAEEQGPNRARLLRSASVYRQRNDPDADGYETGLEGLVATPETSVSRCLPVSPGDTRVSVSRRLPPYGETETLDPPENPRVSPSFRTGVLHDYRTGLNYDIHTGEVLS